MIPLLHALNPCGRTSAEAEKNARAVKRLASVQWAASLVRETQKPAVPQGIAFELRFAYELARADITPQHAFKTEVGNSDVDFRLPGLDGKPAWNVELVTLEFSEKIKEAAKLHESELDLGLIGDQDEDARRLAAKQTPEHEMLRTLSALEDKVYNKKKQQAIKCPEFSKAYRATNRC